jgi:hypothetical protein
MWSIDYIPIQINNKLGLSCNHSKLGLIQDYIIKFELRLNSFFCLVKFHIMNSDIIVIKSALN